MSTRNFKTMLYGMPMICSRTFGQMAEDYEENEFTPDDYYFESQFEFDNAEAIAKEFSDSLKYHDVTIESGYYDGFQFYVQEKYDNYFDMDKSSRYCIDNENAHYYFDVCRSVAIREADREKRKIEKWLYSLADRGYNIVDCVAVFSNGAAEYSIRTKRTAMIAAARA